VAGKVLPGQIVHATCAYPGGYFAALDELASSVTQVLRVPVSAPEQGRVQSVLANTNSMDAYRFYADGKKRMQSGGRDGLTAAIDCFQKALGKDPDYALAFAAMSEAQLKLSKLQEDDGEDPASNRTAAVENAKRAVASRRAVGEAHRQLAHAYAATGNYQDAGVEAQSAVDALPSDAAAYLELAKALGEGKWGRNPAMDRALQLGPWLVKMEAQFPQVTVVNNSQYDIEAVFVLGNAEPYARVKVSPNSSRLVGLLPGAYRVTVRSILGNKNEDFTFESGKDYNLTYDASTWPIALVHVTNKTGVQLYMKVGDVKLAVANGKSSTLKLQPGTYKYQAKAGPATGSGSKQFEAGVYDWVFSASSFPKAMVTVANRTHSTLSLQVDGRTPLVVAAGKDKQLVLYPGSHSFTASAGGLALRGSKQIDAGESIWTFSGGSFPTAVINLANTGNVTVRVSISGPTKRTVSVGGGKTVQLIVAPGNYAVHASAGGATQDDSMSLSAGDERTLTYQVVTYYR
jgi:tetratricopeptide (TPR) repeat protein